MTSLEMRRHLVMKHHHPTVSDLCDLSCDALNELHEHVVACEISRLERKIELLRQHAEAERVG